MPDPSAHAAARGSANLHIPPRKLAHNASELHVELIAAPNQSFNKIGHDLTSVIHEQADQRIKEDTRTDDHLFLAVLDRRAYLDTCHGVMTECMDALAKAPKERSPLELSDVERMFAATAFFQNLSRSTMIRRNCCRFLGILTFQKGEMIYSFDTEATRAYIIMQGHADIYDGRLGTNANVEKFIYVRAWKNKKLFTYGPGKTFGQEALTSDQPTKYQHTAVCTQEMAVAVISKADYMRICNTDGMQEIIDKFWLLALEHSKVRRYGDSERDGIDFEGYKQLYLRIGKVITTKQMFSQKELRATMMEDWDEDLETFGSPKIRSLDYDQYSDSLFQLIDEWSGGVEWMELYEGLLQLMLTNFTTLSAEGELKLIPLKKVECCFQQLSDMKSVYAKKMQQYQVDHQIGLDEFGLSVKSANLKSFHEKISRKGIFKSIRDMTKGEGGRINPNGGDSIMGLLRDMFDAVD